MKIIIFLFCLVFLTSSFSLAEAAVPAQFIAKLYSEALGRIPDQNGWRNSVAFFNWCGCNKSCLKDFGKNFFFSTEYTNLGYSNEEKLLTLYRTILNREPDSSGYNWWLGQMNAGVKFGDVVNAFYDSSEFASLVPEICSGESYGWGDAPAINIPVNSSGFKGGSGEELQRILNRAAPGSTVWLAQRSVTRINNTLEIPRGVTLATYGNPLPNKYAKMARLVRVSNFNASLLRLNSGAKLKNVWVDGQLNILGIYPRVNDINIQIMGGSGVQIVSNRISRSAGWTALQALGSAEGYACGSNWITSNLITSYASSHYWSNTGDAYWGGWSDGLSIGCENATVEYNQIIDATDVAIVVFRATPAIQRSIVRNNTILNAGNSAYGGMGFDPLTPTYCNGCNSANFRGSSIENNIIWSGPDAHYDIVASLGTMAWYYPQSIIGTGARFVGNSAGTEEVRANNGIVIDGMLNATVLDNTLNVNLINFSRCPVFNIAADISGGHASGTIQQPYDDIAVHACIGH